MSRKMVTVVVGARPNFVKMAPVVRALGERGVALSLVHTGQHYDDAMSRVFFDELALPRPDADLGVGSGSHAAQTAAVMVGLEPVLARERPALVVVAGDVNSTVAAALCAAKLGIPVAHVESGLRSFDRAMPEELNRVVTDHLSELLFVTESSGAVNLRREGVDEKRVHVVGNTMIDSLDAHLPRALARAPWRSFDLAERGYGVVTLHRPSNVDNATASEELFAGIGAIAAELPLVFPMHPRTAAGPTGARWRATLGVKVVAPLGYLDFLALQARAAVVITDSGGVQEETTALGVACLTVRTTTERSATVDVGTNLLVGPSATAIVDGFRKGKRHGARRPPLWDGAAAGRVADVVARFVGGRA